MEKRTLNSRIEAFTLIELLVIIVTVVLIACFTIPGLVGTKQKSRRQTCLNNLKQVTLSFKLWPSDSSDRFPMARSTNDEGTLEFIGTGDTFCHFQVMSNELSTTKVLICPADVRTQAKDFGVGFSNTNVSYFVGVDADASKPEMLLTGDRNITNGLSPTNGMLILTTNIAARWTRDMHNREGNVALADGHVEQADIPGLQKLIEHTGVASNRLALP